VIRGCCMGALEHGASKNGRGKLTAKPVVVAAVYDLLL